MTKINKKLSPFPMTAQEDASKQTWISWFLQQPLGKYFIEIDKDYLMCTYNFYGIRQKVSNFKQALDLIRGPYIPPEKRPTSWVSDIDDYGICLYGLLHARYLLTDAGLERMHEKYLKGPSYPCPRTLCNGANCLPYGASDDIGQSTVKMFCPCCHDVYHIQDDDGPLTDGSFFGPSYVHLFLAKYPSIMPKPPINKYVPRIFGFKICPETDFKDEEEDEEEYEES